MASHGIDLKTEPASGAYPLPTDYLADSCLHELIEAQVERSPESVAFLFERQSISYREMNARANQVAHHLRALGVQPDVTVGICMERSPEMVLGLVGILKAGGAYVPLDPAYPKDRLAFTLADSQVPVLVTQRRLLETLPATAAHSLCLDPEWWWSTQESTENPARGATPDDLAYVIYTSGSTGRPKGVEVEHRGLASLVETQFRVCGVGPRDRVLQFCSLSFDPSIFEIGIALRTGATLVLAPQSSLLPGPALARVLRDQCVTTIVLPPSVLSPLPDEPFPSLRTLIVGAEPVTAEFVKRWGDGRRIFNIYGATETTVFSTIAECRADGRKPSIGRPIANTRVFILDSRLRPVPVGVPGELYVGGAGVARGYLGRPDLTAARFVPDPFGEAPGGRLYRTGDLARYLADGNIEFLGRVDNQVKVRGHRIEPEEIEAVLAQHPGVRECAVALRHDSSCTERLVAYIVALQEPGPSASDLRAFLGSRLPNFMVPSNFVRMQALPLAPSGKVDRKTLPAPEGGRTERDRPYEAPRNKLELLLAELWQEALGLEKVGIHDDFFELSGDSLNTAVLLNELQERLRKTVYVVALLDAPTVARLAEYLEKHYPDAVARMCGAESIRREARSKARINAAQVAQFRQLLPRSGPLDESQAARRATKPSAIFILCPPRSGSTLLRVMLAGHPNLFAPPELQLLPFRTLRERRAAFSGRNNFWLQGAVRAIMEAKGCTAEKAQGIMNACEERELSTQEFYARMQEWIGARRLVDKTTRYALDVDTLKRAEVYFERPLYIHLLRHPCGMIRSFDEARMDQIFEYEHPFSVTELAELIWLISHENIMEFLRGIPKDRQRRVRFEHLVGQPEEVVHELCAFLGVDFHPDVLRPYEHQEKRMTDDLHGLPRMLGDLSFHQHQKIDANVAERWKENGSERMLGDITWRVAGSLGYERPAKSGGEAAGGELIEARSSAPRVMEIQPGGSKPPFFCVHQSTGYRALASELGPDQPVYVLPYGYLFEKQTERPLRDLAAELVREIRTIQPEGPYFLGGMCLAGHVALAIAQEVHAQREEVGLLALFDCRAPDYIGFQSGVGRVRYVRERVNLHLRNLLRRGRKGTLPYVRNRLRNLRWLAGAWLWTAYYKFWQRVGRPLPNNLRDSFRLMRRAVLSSQPTPVYPGRVALFMSATHRAKELNLDGGFGWSRIAGGSLEVYEEPGSHRDLLLPPNVAILARQLQTCLRKAQAMESSLYKVVVNLEEQYSIWLADQPNPAGWRDAGKSGSEAECLAYVKTFAKPSRFLPSKAAHRR